MRLHKFISIGLIIFSQSSLGLENFGDEVVNCLADKRAQPTDKNFKTLNDECVKQVQNSRNEIEAKRIVQEVMDEYKKQLDEYNLEQQVMGIALDNYYCYADKLEEELNHIDFHSFKDCKEAKNIIWNKLIMSCADSNIFSKKRDNILKFFKGNQDLASGFGYGLVWSNQAMVNALVYSACRKKGQF